MYREALKHGFYELQSTRDWYREATIQEGMHRDLILRWIEVQALLLSPIAPHWCEYVWQKLLEKVCMFKRLVKGKGRHADYET